MKRVAILVIVLAVIFSATAFARIIDRYEMDGVKVITSAFIHTAKGDFKLDLSRNVFNVYSEMELDALWKELCDCAKNNGCTLQICDKIVIFFKDFWDVEKAAVLTADREIMADEILNNFSTYLLM